MASREFHAALEHFPKGIATPGDSVAQVREKFGGAHGRDPGPDIRVEKETYGGVGGLWVTPRAQADAARTLVFFHGGAFVSSPAETYTFYAAWPAREVGARAFVVDYRLAPEHPYPAALDDCVAAFRGLVDSGVDPANVAFIGDSCGGGLAVSTLMRLRDAGAALPGCGVALCGWFDLEASGDSAANPVGEDPFIHPQWIRERARDYLGAAGDARDPYVSPIHADLAGLPPLLLQTGQVDTCRSDSVRLAERAGRDGVAVTLEIWPDMIHGFQGMYGACPEPTWAFRHVRDFVHHHIRP